MENNVHRYCYQCRTHSLAPNPHDLFLKKRKTKIIFVMDDGKFVPRFLYHVAVQLSAEYFDILHTWLTLHLDPVPVDHKHMRKDIVTRNFS